MFIRKYWIPLLVFSIAIVGVGLYQLTIQSLPEPIVIYGAAEPLENSSAKAPQGDPSQGRHFHPDGTFHETQRDAETPPMPESKTVEPILTSSELDALYHQITAEISEMSSAAELDNGLDLSKYSPKQLEHLQKVGINLSRLPKNLQDKITNHQWRQKDLEPPPQGYAYLQDEDGTYFLYKKGEPMSIQNRPPSSGISFFFMGEMDGQTEVEIMEDIMKSLTKGLEGEK